MSFYQLFAAREAERKKEPFSHFLNCHEMKCISKSKPRWLRALSFIWEELEEGMTEEMMMMILNVDEKIKG